MLFVFCSKVTFYISIKLILQFSATVLAECPVTWHHYEDSCYFFSHEKLNWFNAQGSCRAHDARLAEVLSRNQQDFLRYTASLYGTSSDFWLGARDDLEEGKWQWSFTKNYFSFTDWAPHEPMDGLSANCLQMWSAHNWQWDDYPCTAERKYICESKIPETVVG
ncbi:C-type lectin domain family 4 member E [Mytilus galloprovincialis]|uniref:C-type lectin domain family 4 member E n=1 Tax=Mytilus galloprovincialis TaxID=29158 RepID=A0A8B6BH79_MYTGA|nr:C-type lectin domain family 4 member E [Mytilus galloprovincialis]